MSTTHHRTRIRATKASSLTATARTITGAPSTKRGPRYCMRVLPSPTTRPCNNITTPRRIEPCRC